MEPENPSEAAIRGWCVDYLSRVLDLSATTIADETRFSQLGLDSASAVSFIVELEDRLDLELTPEVIFEYPTIAELARFLAACRRGDSGAAG